MTIFYNEPKEGSKFASIGGFKWEEVNVTVEFDELRFCSDDNWLYLFGYATKFTDLVKIGDKDWKFTSQLVTFEIAKSETVQIYDFKNKKNVDRSQSPIEKLISQELLKLDEDKAYKGFITFQSGKPCEILLTGKSQDGKPLADVIKEQLLQTFILLEETSTELIPKDEVKPKTKGNWKSGGSRGQTEKERINDRWTFFLDQLALAGIEHEIKSVVDLNNASDQVISALNFCQSIWA